MVCLILILLVTRKNRRSRVIIIMPEKENCRDRGRHLPALRSDPDLHLLAISSKIFAVEAVEAVDGNRSWNEVMVGSIAKRVCFSTFKNFMVILGPLSPDVIITISDLVDDRLISWTMVKSVPKLCTFLPCKRSQLWFFAFHQVLKPNQLPFPNRGGIDFLDLCNPV
jgi:hypothetical protein